MKIKQIRHADDKAVGFSFMGLGNMSISVISCGDTFGIGTKGTAYENNIIIEKLFGKAHKKDYGKLGYNRWYINPHELFTLMEAFI